jgi:hypothetical protein
MPMVYEIHTKQVADSFATSGTGSTELSQMSIKAQARNVGVTSATVTGRGAGLTALSGIAFRLKKFTSTASSSGTTITAAPLDTGMQAAKSVSVAASSGLSLGTGGPLLVGALGCGAAGPGGWVARDVDHMPSLEGGSSLSIDMFSVSGTASLNWEGGITFQE